MPRNLEAGHELFLTASDHRVYSRYHEPDRYVSHGRAVEKVEGFTEGDRAGGVNTDPDGCI